MDNENDIFAGRIIITETVAHIQSICESQIKLLKTDTLIRIKYIVTELDKEMIWISIKSNRCNSTKCMRRILFWHFFVAVDAVVVFVAFILSMYDNVQAHESQRETRKSIN